MIKLTTYVADAIKPALNELMWIAGGIIAAIVITILIIKFKNK